ncbi:unnamed protein product [Schistosoma mattheei]|uniref:Uncharacterized protein n=1 Tax=Schistosoma mattheei TaxID=31246 RepID=A0A183NIJ6_9TREM|nr:unnamed protein product [Schistosoma mattheei]
MVNAFFNPTPIPLQATTDNEPILPLTNVKIIGFVLP